MIFNFNKTITYITIYMNNNQEVQSISDLNTKLIKAFQKYEQVLEGYTVWNPPASVQNINPNKDLEWYTNSVDCINNVIIPMLHNVPDIGSLNWNLVSKSVLVSFMNHYFSDSVKRSVLVISLFKGILSSVTPSSEFTELCDRIDHYHKWSLLMLCCHRKNASSEICKLLIQTHNVSVSIVGGESNMQTIFHMLAERCTSDNPTVTDLDRARFFDKLYTCIKYSTDRSVLLKRDKNNQTFLDILNKEESKHIINKDYAMEYINNITVIAN